MPLILIYLNFNVFENNTYFDLSDSSNKGSRLRFFLDKACKQELSKI